MRYAALGLVCLTLAGCGNGLASVGGTVTLDGRPLAGSEQLSGTVSFLPEDGHGTATVGYLDANGKYQLSSGSRVGIVPGRYVVSISATQIIPPKIPGEAPSGRPASPARYGDPKTSGFKAEVAPGSNTFDFALSSR